MKSKNIYKSRIRAFSVIVALTFSFSFLHSEITSAGKDFWLAFLAGPDIGDMYVFLSSDKNASGEISVPGFQGNQWMTTFYLPANTSTSINIPDDYFYGDTSEIVKRAAVHVTSDVDINCFAMNLIRYASDGTLVLPTEAIGNDYVVLTYFPCSNTFSELMIVPTEANTEITIIPSKNSRRGVVAGTPVNLFINKGFV